MKKIYISEIADFLNKLYFGEDYTISKVSSLDKISDDTLSFSKKSLSSILDVKALILVPLDFIYEDNSTYSVIKVSNPRLAFAKVVNHFFIEKPSYIIDKTASIGNNTNIASNVSIGKNSIIGKNVTIGENSIILHNVVITDNSTIGMNCYIKSGAIIGEDGFGFDFEEDGTPIRIPHLGAVSIGNNVEVGSNSVIVRGTLDNTIIKDNVKIDDLVFIAHNCFIEENTVIIASAEISGSVKIGKNCWIAPNSSIIQKVSIGNNVTIGIGAVVTKDIEDNKKIMGLESLELRPLLKVKRRIDYGK